MAEQLALALARPKPRPLLALPAERPPRLRFDVDDAERAGDRWGFSCGPAAICALLGLTPDQLRPHLERHSRKRSYMTPDDVLRALDSLGVRHSAGRRHQYPQFGFARIQWGGPWLKPGVPYKARYCYTHWVASCGGCTTGSCRFQICDINATCVGWMSLNEWSGKLVPWLLKEAVPRADGSWSITHTIEVTQ